MAKQYFDVAITTEKDDMSKTSGAALTLTNQVRVIYDDTLTTSELHTLITRIRDKIAEVEQ